MLLLQSGIPHQWVESELTSDSDYEQRIDNIVDGVRGSEQQNHASQRQIEQPAATRARFTSTKSQHIIRPARIADVRSSQTLYSRAVAWRAVAAVAVGGILMSVGTLLPWQIFSGSGFALYRSSFDLLNDRGSSSSDGLWTLLSAFVILFGAISMAINYRRSDNLPKSLIRSYLIFAVIAVLVFVSDYPGVSQTVNDLSASGSGFKASVGYGFWLCGVGALVTVVGCCVLLRVPQRRSGPIAGANPPVI
jgi:hypothetical protein